MDDEELFRNQWFILGRCDSASIDNPGARLVSKRFLLECLQELDAWECDDVRVDLTSLAYLRFADLSGRQSQGRPRRLWHNRSIHLLCVVDDFRNVLERPSIPSANLL